MRPLNDVDQFDIESQFFSGQRVVGIHDHFGFGDLSYGYICGCSARLRDWQSLTDCRLPLPMRELAFSDLADQIFSTGPKTVFCRQLCGFRITRMHSQDSVF